MYKEIYLLTIMAVENSLLTKLLGTDIIKDFPGIKR